MGSGHVHCAHGILPVPAPATAYILQGLPIYGGSVKGELCTPTGAALLKHFATEFGKMPVMRVGAIGYGMGKKDFPAANCVRSMLGEAGESSHTVCQLSCNVDDMTAEAISFSMDRLFDAGALEVYTTPAGMKKSRPGTLICALCPEAAREAVVEAMLRHTTTIGIRESLCRRYVLERHIESIETPYGVVRRKDPADTVSPVPSTNTTISPASQRSGVSVFPKWPRWWKPSDGSVKLHPRSARSPAT